MKRRNKTLIFDVVYLKGMGHKPKERVMRRIELKETQTLDTLHNAIINKSFKWIDEHLYSFFMDNKPFSENSWQNISQSYSCNHCPN